MAHEEPSLVSLDHSYVVPDDVVFREVDGESVILDLTNATYFGLDAVGTRIWQLVIEHGALVRVFETLLSEYDVDPAVLQADLLDLVGRLQARQLLRQTA